MTEYIYKNWEPNKGFENLQADVFNEANQFKFAPANGDQIKQEYEQEKVDPQTIQYAFHGDKMIAYVKGRMRKKSKEVHISFPWAVQGTPVEVQDKLFADMILYLQRQYPSYQLRVNAMAKPEENLDFLKKRGFVERNLWKAVYLSVQSLVEASYKIPYTSRLGSEYDIDALIKLFKADGRYSAQFPTDEDIVKYFRDNVFTTGHLILLYENDKLIAASAPLVTSSSPEEEESIIQRFTAYKFLKEQKGSIPLLIELAKECLVTGYGANKPFLTYIDDMDSPRDLREFIGKITPLKSKVLMYYYYLKN
ncbi:MAG: hypothetical protein EAX86_11090 [Candidatus Heimdallarchaeota archaeon]|nr:hypothetical protein [Candidatus Heimdallarchaeota archaeon]